MGPSAKRMIPIRLATLLAIEVICAGSLIFAQNDGMPSQDRSQQRPARYAPQKVQFNTFAYRDFISFVGLENERLRGNFSDGKAHDVKPKDYSAGMGIDLDEEQVMRVLVLDAYQKQLDLNARKGCDSAEERVLRALQQRIDEATIETFRDRSRWCDKEELSIARNVANKLMNALKPESFKKVDFYVSIRGWGPKMILVNPCQPYQNPGPGEAAHNGCQYGGYFEALSNAYDNDKRSIGEFEEPDLNHYEIMMVPLSLEQKRTVVSIARDETRDIAAWQVKFLSARDQYAKEHHLQFVQTPYPPELAELENDGAHIVEKHIAELKEVIGEQLFTLLDKTIYGESYHLEPETQTNGDVPSAKATGEEDRD